MGLNRRVAGWCVAAAILGAWGAPATAGAQSPTAPCDAVSPIAVPCVALGKTTDAVAAECRRVGIPDTQCVLPLAHRVTQAARTAYLASWTHRTAQFQYALGNALPFADAQWIGTHNSFNSVNDTLTLSHSDSNQQLSLTQQLDIDVRALELDLHYIPRLELLGGRAVTVCHGQGPDAADLGCTNEPLFTAVLPQIASWLNAPAHRDQVILLYLEDEMKTAAGYASAVATLDHVLRAPDGTSLIYHPDLAQHAANGCTPLPLSLSRDDVRAAGARVVLVGNCATGWAGDVYDWNPVHVESGSTAAYQPPPACDATYGPAEYATKLVRYYEDSTLVSTLIDPTRPPQDPEALTPAKVASMTACGVNLFGFDQLLPEDGRLQASLWSWADGEPRTDVGSCALQRADGRWVAAPCGDAHRAACRTGGVWTLSSAAVPYSQAVAACADDGTTFAVPRSGEQNTDLRATAGTTAVWVRYRVPAAARRRAAACRSVSRAARRTRACRRSLSHG